MTEKREAGVLITTATAAKRLGVSYSRAFALIAEGRLPAKKYGHIYLINEKDLALVRIRTNGRPRKKQEKNQ